jgi:hypothetical protein
MERLHRKILILEEANYAIVKILVDIVDHVSSDFITYLNQLEAIISKTVEVERKFVKLLLNLRLRIHQNELIFCELKQLRDLGLNADKGLLKENFKLFDLSL